MSLQNRIMAMGIPAETARAIVGGVANGLTGAGTTQATALGLSASHNEFTTTGAGTGGILPASANKGDKVIVFNAGANALLVYPPVGGQINALGANVGFSVAAGGSAGSNAMFICSAGGGTSQWYALLSA